MIKNWIVGLVSLFTSLGSIKTVGAEKIATFEAREIFVDSSNSKIFCRTMGKGKPLIVIHGGPGLNQDYLLPQLGQLAKNNFVIFYDQRGCGRSTGEIHQDTMNVATFVDDLEAIRKAFHFEKISLLGHSWGGFLAMQYAIAYPQAVDKLILSNSMPASSDEIALFINEYIKRTTPYQEELAFIKTTKEFQEGAPELHEQFYRTIFRTYCHHPEHADLLNLKMSSSITLNSIKINELLKETTFKNPVNLHESLKTLRIPTLVVHGDGDPIPTVTAKNISNSIKHSKYVEMKHCGHFPYVEQPDSYFKILGDFLN